MGLPRPGDHHRVGVHGALGREQRPTLTALVSPDGLYRTGDKVRRFANGYLEVTGRVKDVIHRGGETVSALDLEAHLLTHPSIWAAAAVPVPDEFLGEKICAAVVFSGPPVTLAELHTHLDERGVATHARPDMLVPMPTCSRAAWPYCTDAGRYLCT